MTVSLFHRIQVQKFDEWLNPDPDQVAEMMKSQGASSFTLSRNVNDPNILMIHMQFPDENTAKTYMDFYTKAAEERHGDTATTQEWWLGMDVEGYSGQL